MDMKQLINKMDEMEMPSYGMNEAQIRSSKDAIQVLANLRAMGKQGDMGGQVPPGFANQVVNDLYDVMMYIEANMSESMATEAKKPDFLDLDKDGDKEEPMAKATKDKEEGKDKVEESIVIQADGEEAAALLGMLKLAGMPHEQPAMEERDIENANTPDEHVKPFAAAVPAGNDLHKAKGAYRAAAGGDNPMAMEELNKLEGKLKSMYESLLAQDTN